MTIPVMDDDNKLEKITIYVRGRTLKLLEAEAERTGRSTSAMADFALWRYFRMGVVHVPVRDGEEVTIGGLRQNDR